MEGANAIVARYHWLCLIRLFLHARVFAIDIVIQRILGTILWLRLLDEVIIIIYFINNLILLYIYK